MQHWIAGIGPGNEAILGYAYICHDPLWTTSENGELHLYTHQITHVEEVVCIRVVGVVLAAMFSLGAAHQSLGLLPVTSAGIAALVGALPTSIPHWFGVVLAVALYNSESTGVIYYNDMISLTCQDMMVCFQFICSPLPAFNIVCCIGKNKLELGGGPGDDQGNVLSAHLHSLIPCTLPDTAHRWVWAQVPWAWLIPPLPRWILAPQVTK